jgi:hypothetical protein
MTTAADSRPRTTRIPVTTMEEVPILSEAERAELVASLEKAKAEIAAGDCVEHDSSAFVDHLMSVRAEALRTKQA